MDPITDAADNVYSYPSVSSYPVDDNPGGTSNSLPSASDIFNGAGKLLGQLVNFQLTKDAQDNSTKLQQAALSVQQQSAKGPVFNPSGQINTAALLSRAVGAVLVVGTIVGGIWAFKELKKA